MSSPAAAGAPAENESAPAPISAAAIAAMSESERNELIKKLGGSPAKVVASPSKANEMAACAKCFKVVLHTGKGVPDKRGHPEADCIPFEPIIDLRTRLNELQAIKSEAENEMAAIFEKLCVMATLVAKAQ
jgi:hypothetical protein